MLLLLRTCRRRQVGGLHRAPPDCGAGKFRAGACGWTIIAQDRFFGAVLSPRFFSRSLSWRAGERHCDLVLDRVTRQLRAAHQRAAIKTCRGGYGTPTSRVGEGRVGNLQPPCGLFRAICSARARGQLRRHPALRRTATAAPRRYAPGRQTFCCADQCSPSVGLQGSWAEPCLSRSLIPEKLDGLATGRYPN